MITPVFLLVLVASCSAQVNDYATIPVGTSKHKVKSGGKTRSFTVNNPLGKNATGLMFIFHGWGSNPARACGSMHFNTTAAKVGKEGGFVTVCPQGVAASWNAGKCCGGNKGDDVAFSRAMVKYIRERIDIDPTKVFATGMSNGASFVYRLVCEAPDVFYGAAPGCGTNYANVKGGFKCPSNANRPILHGHGTKDPLQPYSKSLSSYRKYVNSSQGCGSAEEEIYTNPSCKYYKMSCVERQECNEGTKSTFCTYTGLEHTYPRDFLRRSWNYFTTGKLSS